MDRNATRPESGAGNGSRAEFQSPGRNGAPGLNLLLVSRSASWATAVHRATEEIGGGVSTCGARDALARLAGVTPHYSHLLVDEKDADGLLPELASLANEIADPDTDVLTLGAAGTQRPHIRAIAAADTRAVREALMTRLPRSRAKAGIGLPELREALDGAMIDTRYQPIIRVSDRRPVGLEALARLNHPVAGTLPPDQFVPQIEAAGLAARLTQLVSARVLADLAAPALAASGLRMSINFPLDVLLQPASLDRLEEQRAASGVPAGRIVVELTESQPVEDFKALGRALDRLRGLGYGAAIDDFGPAVPLLAPLLELPFTSLKLDKGLVRQAIDSTEVRACLAATVAQAKQRGLAVVAEGVETEEIWAQMAALGADEVQGFLASRPLPAAAVPIWLEAWTAAQRANPD